MHNGQNNCTRFSYIVDRTPEAMAGKDTLEDVCEPEDCESGVLGRLFCLSKAWDGFVRNADSGLNSNCNEAM